jgi:ABC-type phosphate/phosphonate transport system substrate-binding protein
LIGDDVDFMQMNAREYLRAKAQHPALQPLVRGIPSTASAVARDEATVIFTHEATGIRTMADLRGRSFLFGTVDSTSSFWAKVHLAEAGITARDLTKRRYLDAAMEVAADNSTSAAPDIGNPYSDMTPVEAVVNGSYDAAVVRESRFLQVAGGQKLVALKRFDDSPYVLAGQGNLPEAALASLRRAMTNLTEPQMLQMFMGFPRRFERCSDSDFDVMRTKLAAEKLFEGTQ